MNSNYLQSKFGRVILVLSLLFGITMVSSMTAQAQYPLGRDGQDRRDRDYRRNQDRNRDNRGGRGGYNVYQIAQDQGYQAGLNTGASDASRRQSYDPQRSHYYRNATYGYNSSYGNREAYKQAYREGFVRGYREGFQRYGGNRRRNNGRGFPNWP